MRSDLIPAIVILTLIFGGSLVLFVFAIRRIRRGVGGGPLTKVLRLSSLALLTVPFLFIAGLVGWFVIDNFPFTSGIIADGTAPTGEEICVVQTFKDAEPYQVSLYGRKKTGQPWAWNYLAHQDDRWRNCRLEFGPDVVRVYCGSRMVKTLSLAEATDVTADSHESLPLDYTPEQILAHHTAHFR